MGESVRLIYVHVPIVSIAYLGIVAATVGSVMFLWKKSEWWDLVAASTAEVSRGLHGPDARHRHDLGQADVGRLLGVGRPPHLDRSCSSCSCSATRPCGAPRSIRSCGASAPRSSDCCCCPNVIIVNRSVEWWRSLHQEPTLLRLDPTIEGLQLFTLMFAHGGRRRDLRLVHRAPLPARLVAGPGRPALARRCHRRTTLGGGRRERLGLRHRRLVDHASWCSSPTRPGSSCRGRAPRASRCHPRTVDGCERGRARPVAACPPGGRRAVGVGRSW